jgi:putative transposase
MEVGEAQRLRSLEDENRPLKYLVADLSLDKEALKAIVRKNGLELAGLRADAALASFGMSERRACRLVKLDRSSYRYEPRADYNAQLREERSHVPLSKRGHPASAQRIYRLYREDRLMVRLRRKRLVRSANVGRLLLCSNQEWALDFACDALATGRGIRILAVMDAFTRECLTLEVDTSLSSQRVTRGLEQAIKQRGLPESIRCDKGAGADLAALFWDGARSARSS